VGVVLGSEFDLSGEVEEVSELVVGEVEIAEQVGGIGFEYPARREGLGHGVLA
jgi:hypothetical protein